MKKLTILSFAAFTMFTMSLNAQTWTLLNSGTTESLYGIVPLTDNICISTGDNRIQVKTTNQGGFWSQQLIGTDFASRCLFFTSPSIGFAGGSNGSGNRYIYRTIDGGTTWSIVNTGTPASFYGIHFHDASTGYAVRGNTTTSEVWKTTDGGISWGSLTNSAFSGWLKHIYAADNNNVVCVGVGGKILRTTDGGTSWTSSTHGSYELTDVCFPTTSIGYISGFNGTILKTTDGGLSWGPLTISSVANFYSLAFLDANRGFVVGQNGAIFYTPDGGTTWTNQSGCTSNTLITVRAYSQNLVYACGVSGTIVKYSNTIGIEELNNQLQCSIYPNPSKGIINIEIPAGSKEKYNLKVFNLLGDVVYSFNEIQSTGYFSKQIDLSNLSNGIYFLQLQNKQKRTVKKIVIDK